MKTHLILLLLVLLSHAAALAQEQMPFYYKGDVELMKYIKANQRAVARRTGRVYVQFYVETDSTLTGIRIYRSLEPHADAEALRLVRGLKKYVPGKIDGKLIRWRYTIPITFRKEHLSPEGLRLDSISRKPQQYPIRIDPWKTTPYL